MAVYAGQYGPEPVFDPSGRLLPNTAVTVYAAGGQTAATLYTDQTKAQTTANPVLTDSLGNLLFFADPGRYTIEANGTILNAVIRPDPAEPPLGTPGPTGATPVVDPAQTSGYHWTQFVPAAGGNFTGPVGFPGPMRIIGVVNGAAPTGGPWNTTDVALDIQGGFWICTAGGSPGTWTRLVQWRVSTFSSSGTWTCPAGVTTVEVLLVGGGGGGAAGTSSGYYSGNGGAGAVVVKKQVAVTPGTTYVITIGAAGAGGAVSAGAGSPGGTTTFAVQGGATLLTANGGQGGVVSGSNTIAVPGPLPWVPNSWICNVTTGSGAWGYPAQLGGQVYGSSSTYNGGDGGAPIIGYGSGGGAASNTSTSGTGPPGLGGTGNAGGLGGGHSSTPGTGGVGGTGQVPGAGGGGGSNNYNGVAFAGGPGAPGYCEIRAIY